MYNKEVKLEYLNHIKNRDEPTKDIEDLFNESASYEELLEKDLYMMDTKELVHFLVTYENVYRMAAQRRILSAYVEWCIIKGYTKFNWISIKAIDSRSLNSIFFKAKEEFYISREMYEMYKSKLLHSNYGVYIASAFCATYEGIAGQGFYNLACLRVKDINVEANTIRLAEGKLSEVSAELIQMLLQTANVTEITNENTVKYSSSLYPDSIWKIRQNDEVTIQKMKRKFRFLLNECKEVLAEDKITKTAIEKSGYFNEIYDRLLESGIDIKKIKLSKGKKGESKPYEKYFLNSRYDDMNMHKFFRLFQSYINQI